MVTTRDRVRTPRARRSIPLAAVLCLAAFTVPALARAAAGALEASITPKVVDDGDTVRLTLRFRGDAPAARPDLSPLQRDFEVLGSQQSQRVSIVDGEVDATRELEILLSPKRAGDIEIPALQAGDLATEPLRLTVRDAGAGNAPASPSTASGTGSAHVSSASGGGGARTSADVAARVARNGEMPGLFVDAQVDQAKPFVQGEVRYTVRVYDALGIREGALSEPAAEGVRIEARGDTRTYADVVGGRRYTVHEREFAAFPQSSGEVVIPPVVLQARVADEPGRGRRSAFEDMLGDMMGDDAEVAQLFAQMQRGLGGSILDRMMGSGREVRVRSNPVTLDVQGRPAEAAGGWFLPATSVTLTQTWSPTQPTFRVGDSVKRTITLRADGASATQLPEIAPGDASGVKQYAAKPETRTTASGAELVQSFDVLPTTAGTITLPRVEVPWWDNASNTQRTAVLPEATIEILPAAGDTASQAAQAPAPASAARAAAAAQTKSASTSSSAAPAAHSTGAQPSTAPAEPSEATASVPRKGGTFLSSHPATSAGAAAALLALLGTTAWLVTRRRRDAQLPTTATGGHGAGSATGSGARVPARALVDGVHQACAANDARAVRSALVAWGRAAWSDAATATAVARRTGDAAFVRAVKSLDDSLYAPQAAAFDGAAFRRAFDAARRASTGGGADTPDVLPALYPESRLA